MHTPETRLSLHKVVIYSGYAYIAFLLVGMATARFLPSQPPSLTPDQIAAVYTGDHLWRIRIGMMIALVGSTLYVPWTAMLAKLIMRVEGKAGVLTFCQIIAGCTNVLLTAYPTGYWMLGSFRPDRSPELIQLINDISWTQFLGVITPFFFVPISIAIAALLDKDDDPLIPRWVGWFNIWFELTLLPLVIIFWFHSGPFAWNGIFGFYLPFFVFFCWFFVMTWTLKRSVHRLDEV
jgi:hypothetical protein